MKKLFAAVFLISIFAIVGCASDSSNSSAQAPVEEPLIPANADVPDTLVGQYNVDNFSVVQGTTLLSNNCEQAAKDFPGMTCNSATILANIVDVQPHAENGGMLSFVIQMQLESPEIRNGTLKEHAYHHLLFPIQKAYVPVDGEFFSTKATERGFTDFFIVRPGGNALTKNATLTALKNEGDKILIQLNEDSGKGMRYVYRLVKISNKSNGYVSTQGDPNLQSGLYAISSIFNTLIQSTFEDSTLTDLFEGFKSDIPNQTGADVAQ